MERGEKIKALLASATARDAVCICGWIRQKRISKGIIFFNINDGSCLAGIQAVADESLTGFEELKKLAIGSSVRVRGRLAESPGQGQKYEIQAMAVDIFGDCDEDYPLQKKKHSFEFLRSIAHLRMRTNSFGAVFRVRNAAAYAIHEFFQENGFYYIHTPIITGSDCEGAGEMFHVTTMPLESIPMTRSASGAMGVDFSQDFFRTHAGLTVSGQLEGELFAMALSEIYTFGPTFRAENSNTPRHAAEFWMIEPEMAFYDLDDNIALAQRFIKQVTARVRDRCSEDLAFFAERIDPTLMDRLDAIDRHDFEVLTYTNAVRLLKESGKAFEFPVSWGMDLQTEHERYLTEELIRKPTFVRDYPLEIKAFYMRRSDDGRTVGAMDLLVPRIGEIIGGSQREERLDVLKEMIRSKGLDEAVYWWYIDTRRFGTAPHAGFGLGFERLLQYLTGMANIRDVIPFPRTPGNCEF
ncbi:asparagine--tRNA ligase [bacterium]|nr:asparagine--tRNA ligase [candidate division CSSED10-310 bacterium]